MATTDADGLYAWLRDKGIIVRNRSRVALCEGCLRITVGTPDENAMLIDAMAAFLMAEQSYNISFILYISIHPDIRYNEQREHTAACAFYRQRRTLIVEPPVDYQVDSLGKTGICTWCTACNALYRGTPPLQARNGYKPGRPRHTLFPEETFWPAHNKMLGTFAAEGVKFDDIIIDRTFPEENAPTRKPGTALLGEYTSGGYNLADSYVIGDRLYRCNACTQSRCQCHPPGRAYRSAV